MKTPPVHLVTALACEARPLVQRLRLQPLSRSRGFRVYGGDGIRLVVTGIGRRAAGGGTAHLQGMAPADGTAVWLNVGIAGHRRRPLGEGVVARKIIDGETGECWYPPLDFAPETTTDTLITRDRPDGEYEEDGLYDMEASGFYAAALRFGRPGRIHCYKVVSDNRESPHTRIGKKQVVELMERNLAAIDTLIRRLRSQAPVHG